MRAVRYDGQHVVLETDAPEPTLAGGDALLSVRLAMPDATDAATARGDTGFRGVLSRRFVGVVKEPGADQTHRLKKGARVVAEVNLPDAASDLARRGLGRHDPERRVLGLHEADGVLAERVAVPARALVEVPGELTDEQALFAVPVGDAVHTARLLRLDSKSYVTVVGESLEALLMAQVMARENHTVRLLARDSDRLELCERWGVRRRHTDEAGRRQDQDVVVVADATPESVSTALGMVRPRGTVVLRRAVLGVPGQEFDDACREGLGMDLRDAIDREITMIGARCGPVRVGVQTIAGGGVDLSGLVSDRLALADGVTAVRRVGEGDALAVVVEVGGR
ncbi:MAG: alcohol dehydrogenase catalytic domain-containing protein [Phycisphaerales bacterium JB040]